MMWVEKIKDLFLYFTIFVYFILAFTPKVLGAAFLLCVLMIAHPHSVLHIISQFETPLVIRIGLVIMTYPILFASVWFGFKIFTYLDDEPDPKKEDDEESGCASAFLFFPFLILLILLGLAAWDELQLHHQLLQDGVSGAATVQKCEKQERSRGGDSCYMSYDYEVPSANNRTESYSVREPVGCARVCDIGSSVDITYLPQTPSEAGIEGNTARLIDSVSYVTIFFNFFLLLLSALWRDLINWALGLIRWGETKEMEIARVPSLKDRPFKLDKEEIIIEALRTDPQDARAWLILGWMVDKPERTRECYERALKIHLRSEREELSALSLPTWLDLVTAEEEMPLVYPSPPPVSLPNWLDEEESPSFFSRLRAILLDRLILFFSLIFISLSGSTFSHLFFGEAPLTLFFGYSFAITMSLLPLTAIFYMLKLLHVSKDSRDWPSSEAIVIGSFVKRWKNKGKRRHSLYVVCAYQVDQQIYYSTVPSENPYLIDSSYQSGGDESDHYLEQKEKEYRFPKRMTVFYNPRQPHIVFHQVGFHSEVVELLVITMGGALLSGLASYALWQALLRSGS